jgi:hypothetical protein
MIDVGKIEAVMRYHERTKHHFNRYARGPGQLDWVNQPNPFRRYEGAPLVHLPILKPDQAPLWPTGLACTTMSPANTAWNGAPTARTLCSRS